MDQNFLSLKIKESSCLVGFLTKQIAHFMVPTSISKEVKLFSLWVAKIKSQPMKALLASSRDYKMCISTNVYFTIP